MRRRRTSPRPFRRCAVADEIPAGHIASVHREASRLSPGGEMLDFRYGLVSPCPNGHPRALIFVSRRDWADRWFSIAVTEDTSKIESEGVLDALVATIGDMMCQDATIFGVPWDNVTCQENAAEMIAQHQMSCAHGLSARFRQMSLDQLEKLRGGINELDARRVLALMEIVNDYLRWGWDTDGPQALG